MATPWLTSSDIVLGVQRAIAVPLSQQTFTEDDILYFANQEMFIGQVPSVLQYHQEFFVYYINIELVPNKSRYPIPDRAIGMKMRDLFYLDNNNNLFEMTRINPEEKAWFQRDFNTGRQPYPYYLEGNDIVLPSTSIPNPTGSFQISFFIRPNQLVDNSNASIIQNFGQQISIINSSITVGDMVVLTKPLTGNTDQNPTATYTAVTGSASPGQFLIGVNSATTAQNLVNAINADTFAMATLSGTTVNVFFNIPSATVTSISNGNPSPGLVPSQYVFVTFDQIPTSITNTTLIDFLQTKPGHKIYTYDVSIPINGISGTTVLFNPTDVPSNCVVGDYICAANTSIIPYLPPDLHNVLVERTAARILAAMGDTEGLGMINSEIQRMQQNQGMLLDNRVEGKVQKVSNKHSMLRYGKRMIIRRF